MIMKSNKAFTYKNFLLVMVWIIASCNGGSNAQPNNDNKKTRSIKIAILLDTSNSMDGLIDQAKSQLWSIVNTLAKAKCDNTKPELKIALYEYGNNNLPSSEGFIRMVTPLTNDLDRISEALFSLKTNGGDEFCGQVIKTALTQLDWSSSHDDYQVIFIAGNEPFTQGSINYINSCNEARQKGVIVNTIFCGNFDEGISTKWKDGALLTRGEYLSIQQDRKTVYITTPYDDEIVALNSKLNDTYVYFGYSGKDKKTLQSQQDANAFSFGKENVVNRAVSKSSYVYKNSSWDLVDAYNDKEVEISKIEPKELPSEMQKMTVEQRIVYINTKKTERENITRQINDLNIKREAFLANQQINNNEMLDNAIVESIKKQAANKTFVF